MTTNPEARELPSVSELARATAVAFVVGAIVVVTAVLPAEYGVDPTGIGTTLGLMRPPEARAARATPALPATVPADSHLLKATEPFRTDDTEVTLASGKGVEIKANMRRGQRLVFGWSADGPVDFDMHGEATGAARDEFTSYWKDSDATSGHGAFDAPFDGTHGWYWQNLTTEPVTVRLKTSGYYQSIGRPKP
jgi:hypothetical protein